MSAITTFHLAWALERLRWSGTTLGEGVISTAGLIDIGRSALGDHGLLPTAGGPPDSVSLAVGWVVHSCGELPDSMSTKAAADPAPHQDLSPSQAATRIAAAVLGRTGSPTALGWGVAHLIERMAGGTLDILAAARKPDDPPVHAWANVLLVSDQGEIGIFEVRRQRSLLDVPTDIPVPDLARLAFIHGTPDCLDSVGDAYAAAREVAMARAAEVLERTGELISWSLQATHGSHPLAERTVSGCSAGLGAYIAFRSLGNLKVFADREVAFTGQVSADGSLGKVGQASGKIRAASDHGMRLIIHPVGQAWAVPDITTVRLQEVERAEDAVIEAVRPLRDLRRYLEAACHLVAPEPWLQAWLARRGDAGAEMPLLNVTCRHLHPPLPAGEPAKEAEIAPCPAHLLALTYPDTSFVISADAGCGSTVAAKRMAAEAARQALESLRALRPPDRAAFILPLYVPLGELPSSWGNLIQAAVEALPELADSSLDVSAALANALRSDDQRSWRALAVIDGTDRTRRGERASELDKERNFVALVAGSPNHGRRGWRPSQDPQIVLCGRRGSPAHWKAAEALRRERPAAGAMATMGLDPLSGREVDRFVTSLSGGSAPLSGKARALAANPLLLALSVIAGRPQLGDSGPVDLFDRGIDVLLGPRTEDRRLLAEIAFRAALAKRAPVGEFILADIAALHAKDAVNAALTAKDNERARHVALDLDERHAFESAEEETHLVTASGNGWRFFHDRAFAFLVADRIARHAAEEPGTDDALFGVLGPYLGDPLWTDVVEATGRLLELHDQDTPAPLR
jgi:hypothetical protein